MIVAVLAAVDESGGIGIHNRLPWHLPNDLKRFKSLTMGHHLIAGRKTYQSIGRSLPGRTMIVVTRQAGFMAPDCLVASSLKQALRLARERDETQVFIIGGGQIFAQALALADRMYLTRVHTRSQADVFFPAFDASEWTVVRSEEHSADERHAYAYTFVDLERVMKPGSDPE